MTDEQIAQAYLEQYRNQWPNGVAVTVLTAIIGEARATERARCAAIAERYTHTGAGYPVPVERVARDIWYAIRTEGED